MGGDKRQIRSAPADDWLRRLSTSGSEEPVLRWLTAGKKPSLSSLPTRNRKVI